MGRSLSVTCVMMPSVPSEPTSSLQQVVAGHVFDDAPAGLEFAAFVIDGADADDVIAHRAVAVTARPADVGRDRAAERGALALSNVKWQMQIFLLR